MMNFRKLSISKIISLVVAFTFFVTSTAYGIDLSNKTHLRKPLLFNESVSGDEGEKRGEEGISDIKESPIENEHQNDTSLGEKERSIWNRALQFIRGTTITSKVFLFAFILVLIDVIAKVFIRGAFSVDLIIERSLKPYTIERYIYESPDYVEKLNLIETIGIMRIENILLTMSPSLIAIAMLSWTIVSINSSNLKKYPKNKERSLLTIGMALLVAGDLDIVLDTMFSGYVLDWLVVKPMSIFTDFPVIAITTNLPDIYKSLGLVFIALSVIVFFGKKVFTSTNLKRPVDEVEPNVPEVADVQPVLPEASLVEQKLSSNASQTDL